MSKSYQELMEATGALIKNFMGPTELMELKIYCRELSQNFQPTIPDVLQELEARLNFFGYTMGQMESEEDLEIESLPSANEDLFIMTYAQGEIVRNCYISMAWDKLASGQIAVLGKGQRANALRYDVKLEVVECSPSEIEAMLGVATIPNQSGPLDYFNPDEGSEEEENIQP